MEDFETYLRRKKIDSEAFRRAEESVWLSLREVFEQVHPDSFTMQKLFLINKIRRTYHLKQGSSGAVSEA